MSDFSKETAAHPPNDIPADIAVIVVNYGTADLSIAAVQSVLDRQHRGRDVQVYLVDNASPNGDGDRFRTHHDQQGWGDRVTLVLEPENHGFGRGNNVILRHLAKQDHPPKYVFLLNPDAQLENEAIAILADQLDSAPDLVATGAGIRLPSGRNVTAAFRFPSALSEFESAACFGPISRLLAAHRVPLPPDSPEMDVDWVAGAAVMMRLDAVQECGGFDPAFFLYFEEVDLMRQLRNRGGRIRYVPSARIIHEEGAATQVKSHQQKRKAKPQYWYESWGIYFVKNHGRGGAFVALIAWWLGAVLNVPVALLRRKSLAAPRHMFRDVTRFVLPKILRKGASHG